MFFGGKFKFGPDRNAEGMAIGFGCVVVCVSVCSEFLAGNLNANGKCKTFEVLFG